MPRETQKLSSAARKQGNKYQESSGFLWGLIIPPAASAPYRRRNELCHESKCQYKRLSSDPEPALDSSVSEHTLPAQVKMVVNMKATEDTH